MDEPEPGYSISVESDHIFVQHTGELTVPELEASRREAARLAAERRLSLILADISRATPSWLTTSEVFHLCASHHDVLPTGATIAIVYRPDQGSDRVAQFAEAVSLRRGVRLRSFTDLKAAERWLFGKSSH
jgi:hypothetical protein